MKPVIVLLLSLTLLSGCFVSRAYYGAGLVKSGYDLVELFQSDP
jgi:hypothetical protein